MKRYPTSRRVMSRSVKTLGAALLILSCAVIGGADPVAQIEAARAARAKLQAASEVEGLDAGREEAAAFETESVAAPAAVVSAGDEAPELDYVGFDADDSSLGDAVKTSSGNGSNRITVALDDVPLEDTVRLLAQTTGANIIVSGALLEGLRVTVNLRDVDWRPALRSILDIHGLDLVERTPDSGVFSIQPKLPDAPEPTQVETFFLDFITTGEIQTPIKNMLRGNAVLTTFPSRNAIVVRSTEGNLGEIRALIANLDRPGRQVLIETKIMELSDDAVKQLGIRWDSLAALGVRADVSPFSYKQTESNVRTTEKEALLADRTVQANTGRDFFTQVSRRPESSANPDYVQDFFGSQSSYDAGSESFAFAGATTEGSRSVLDTFTRTILKEQSAVLEMDTLSVVLIALEKMDGVSIVSNPMMLVTSGSTNAFFSVGRRDPIIESELKRGTAESPGDVITSRLMDTDIKTDLIEGGYFRTGVDLAVVATVKTDDYIEALIKPSLRRLLDFKEVGINSWPVISVKEINTTFTLRSGQTVAIGGLTDVQDSKVTSKVPVLGSLPFLGRLFSHEKDVKSQIETIIFVTLSVANPGDLDEHAGIPEDAQLVHRRRLHEQVKRAEFGREIQKLRDEQKTLEPLKELAPAEEPAEEEEDASAPVML